MSTRDTIALLRDLDPVGGRTLQAPRRSRRRIVAVPLVASLALGLALLTTSDDARRPTMVEVAHAALTAPDRIVHLKLRSRYSLPKDEPTTTEVWSRAGGKELRVLFDGGEHEFVRDQDRRYAASYVRHRNHVTVYTEPEMYEVRTRAELTFAGPEGAQRIVEQLSALLVRARDGDPGVRRLPDNELAGRMRARLEITETIALAPASDDPGQNGPPHLTPTPVRTIVWFDLDTHLPRRIEHFAPDGRSATTTDVVAAERLPVDASTENLLDMAPHPGATRSIGGRG